MLISIPAEGFVKENSNVISHVSPTATPHVAPQPTVVPENNTQAPQPPTAKPAPTVKASDSVKISAAAQAMQETIETPAQTAKEAAGGDVQARHLLAREAAEKAAE